MDTSGTAIIPGLHFFCDHRCWRCSMVHRCQVPIRMKEHPPTRARPGAGPAGRVAEVVMASLFVTVEQVGLIVGNLPDPSTGSRPPLPPRTRVDDRPAKEAERDGLVARGKEYATGSLRVLQALRPRLARRADAATAETAQAVDAADRLEEMCLTVASKIHRAISSAIEAGADAGDPQADANGSAKVALLLIEESRQAWRVLMQPGRAVGNGTPARFIRTLDELEAGLHQRFPHALEFVRPGFDTEGDGVEGEVARAMLGQKRGVMPRRSIS